MDMTEAYTNAAFIPGGADYPARWRAEAAAFRAAHAPERIAFGPGPRNWAELYRPEGFVQGLLVFVHGGYWLAFDPQVFSHLAAGALAAGWAVALPAYTLAPQARIGAITQEVGQAIAALADRVAGPIRLAGHSAGGHLVARMVCANAPLPASVAARIAKVVPISPLSDLAPLMRTEMNARLGIDAAEAEAESPLNLPPRRGAKIHIWVGGAERPAFLDQAHWLAATWGCPVTVDADRHHFDVIEGLTRPSPLLSCVLG